MHVWELYTQLHSCYENWLKIYNLNCISIVTWFSRKYFQLTYSNYNNVLNKKFFNWLTYNENSRLDERTIYHHVEYEGLLQRLTIFKASTLIPNWEPQTIETIFLETRYKFSIPYMAFLVVANSVTFYIHEI